MISLIAFLFVVLLAAVENSVLPNDDTDNRILGGNDASITEFPSMVYLMSYRGNSCLACGGTIISERWILTAAHCVDGAVAPNVSMRVGSKYKNYGGSVHRGSRIIVHEGYTVTRYSNGSLIDMVNDIALVEAEESFPLNDFTVKAATLAYQTEDTPPETIVTIVGWGLREENAKPETLQKANLPIISRQECRNKVQVTVDERILCAQHSLGLKKTCKGDSGSPVFYNGKVVGINSASTNCTVVPNLPNTSMRVAYFRPWIKEHTGI